MAPPVQPTLSSSRRRLACPHRVRLHEAHGPELQEGGRGVVVHQGGAQLRQTGQEDRFPGGSGPTADPALPPHALALLHGQPAAPGTALHTDHQQGERCIGG